MSSILKVTVDGEESTIDVGKLTFAEGRAVEKVTGQEFSEALKAKSLTLVQALVWVTWKRHHPGAKFSDFDDKAISDIGFDFEADEAAPESPTQPAAD